MGLGFSQDIRKWAKNLDAEREEIEDAADYAAEEIAGRIGANAKQRTPHDTGTLQDSMDVRKVDDRKYKIVFDTHYAVYVHERVELHHDIGEAKYLAKAFDDIGPDVPRLAVRIIKAQL